MRSIELYCSNGFQPVGQKAKPFKRTVGSAHIKLHRPAVAYRVIVWTHLFVYVVFALKERRVYSKIKNFRGFTAPKVPVRRGGCLICDDLLCELTHVCRKVQHVKAPSEPQSTNSALFYKHGTPSECDKRYVHTIGRGGTHIC